MSGTTLDLQEIARRLMQGALTRGMTGARVAAGRSRNVSVTWRKGKADRIQESARTGVTLNLYQDGRYTVCSSNDLRPEALEAFLDRSVALCKAMTPDPFRVLPDPALYAGREEKDLGIFDPAVADVTPDDRKRWAADAEAAALAKAGDKVIQAETTCDDDESELFQIHSNGFEGTHREASFSGYASVSLQDEGDKRPEGDYGVASRVRTSLPGPDFVGVKAAEAGLLRMGTRKLETGTRTLIVENRAARRLLSYLMAATSGRALQQKQSFLDEQVGQPFGSPKFDLRDDPFVHGGFGSRLFDGEGITARPLPIFEQGVFRNFYLDTYYAKKLSLPPTTGGSSNLVLAPGTKSLSTLVSEIQDGILVRGFIGGNSNSTTGDFSLGIWGTRIAGGAEAEAVAEMNIAGNHKDIWKRLVETGDDPWPYGSMRVPSLVFEGVQFSGA